MIDVASAADIGAPKVWNSAPINVCFAARIGDPGATERAFADAAHRVQVRLVNNRVTASSMEPRGAIGTL